MTIWSNQLSRNVGWLTAAEIISRLVVFGAVVRLTNYLGETAFGELSYSFAIANLLVVVADFGLANYTVRELAKQLQTKQSTIKQLLGLKFLLSLAALVLITVIGFMTTHLSWIIIVGGGAAIVLTNVRMFFEAIFRARQQMWLEAITKISHSLLLAAIIMYSIQIKLPVNEVAIGYTIGAASIVVIGLMLVIYTNRLRWPWLNQPKLLLLRQSWPLAASLSINAQFNYLDSAMLGWFGQVKAVAWYSAAYKPIFFMTALAGMIINAFLPTIAVTHHQQQLQQTASTSTNVQTLLHLNLLIALPLAVGGTWLAPEIIGWLYRAEFAPAVPAFQILLWSTVGIYFWAVFGNSLQVCGHERVYLKNFVMALVVTVIGNILLIPVLSLYGAAIATLATQLTLAILMYRSYHRLLQSTQPVSLGMMTIKILLANLTMLAVLFLIPTAWPLLIKIISGAAIYGMVILISGVINFSKNDSIQFSH